MKVNGIEINKWIPKLNDMDRVLLNRIESIDKKIELIVEILKLQEESDE